MSDPELRHLQDLVAELYTSVDAHKMMAMRYHQAVERHKVMRMSSRQKIQAEDKELWDAVLRQPPQEQK